MRLNEETNESSTELIVNNVKLTQTFQKSDFQKCVSNNNWSLKKSYECEVILNERIQGVIKQYVLVNDKHFHNNNNNSNTLSITQTQTQQKLRRSKILRKSVNN